LRGYHLIKIFIPLFLIFSFNALAEPSAEELKHRNCRSLVDHIGEKLDRLKGTTLQRSDFIDKMGDFLTNPKNGELYVDVARQYEYEPTPYRKWSVAYEYCTDHLFDEAYR